MRTRSLTIVDPPEEPIATSQWYIVHLAGRLKQRPVSIRRLGRDMVLWRDGQGIAHAAAAQCPHRGADLGRGQVVSGELQCPFHGFRFEGSGTCTRMPCELPGTRPPNALRLTMYLVREAAGYIWLWHGPGEGLAGLPALPWLPGVPHYDPGAADEEMELPLRFSRAMDGLLDLHHFPFVHASSGRQRDTFIEPYEVEVDGNFLTAHVTMRRPPPHEADVQKFTYTVAYPGQSLLFSPGKLAAYAMMTPIDGERTWLAVRHGTPFLSGPPVLQRLISWLNCQFEIHVVQREDIRVLSRAFPRTMTPRSSVSVRADRLTAEWHKLHARALASSAAADAQNQQSI